MTPNPEIEKIKTQFLDWTLEIGGAPNYLDCADWWINKCLSYGKAQREEGREEASSCPHCTCECWECEEDCG